VGVADAAHELREPGGHGVAVEVAEKRSVMEAYPAAFALGDVALDGDLRHGRPSVRGVVELQERLYWARNSSSIGEVDEMLSKVKLLLGPLLKLGAGGISERLMVAAGVLGEGDDAEFGFGQGVLCVHRCGDEGGRTACDGLSAGKSRGHACVLTSEGVARDHGSVIDGERDA